MRPVYGMFYSGRACSVKSYLKEIYFEKEASNSKRAEQELSRVMSTANQRLFFSDYGMLDFIELCYVSSYELSAMQRYLSRLGALFHFYSQEGTAEINTSYDGEYRR